MRCIVALRGHPAAFAAAALHGQDKAVAFHTCGGGHGYVSGKVVQLKPAHAWHISGRRHTHEWEPSTEGEGGGEEGIAQTLEGQAATAVSIQ